MRSFPYACVGTRGKVKERKAGGWNHRKGQSEVKERRKLSSARDREADRLKCRYKKREREVDKRGYRTRAIHLRIATYTL